MGLKRSRSRRQVFWQSLTLMMMPGSLSWLGIVSLGGDYPQPICGPILGTVHKRQNGLIFASQHIHVYLKKTIYISLAPLSAPIIGCFQRSSPLPCYIGIAPLVSSPFCSMRHLHAVRKSGKLGFMILWK